MKKIKHSFSIVALLASMSIGASGDIEWSYSGDTGPEYWGDLSPEFSQCKNGIEQSPIDLGYFAEENESLRTLKHKFRSVPLTVVNNGHTIQVNTNRDSFTKTELGKQRLLQFHFHSPSENTLDGKQFPLEAHFVHINDEGSLSVVGIFYEEGKKNRALAKILNTAPKHKGTNTKEKYKINPNKVLGARKTEEYFRFAGSLTTPPCTEGVNWYISKNIQSLSAEQIEKFEHLFHGGNARPVQNINDRKLYTTEND
ncbi:carbonic anhydrase [Aliikangiella sp. IMCC44359]|uniref:carbonic anhydrase n=1 Tax=Aliikangiella sp. IMCC44359 TaxID=3459125 RepID=UPI00403AC71A